MLSWRDLERESIYNCFPQESDSRVRDQPCQVEGKSWRLICDESGHQIQSC